MSVLNHDFKQDCAENKVLFAPFESRNESAGATQKNCSDPISPDEIYQSCQTIINGNNGVATWLLEKLVESYPEYAAAYNDLGVIYYNRGDKERALTHYEQAAHLQPENKTFQKNLADLYYVEAGRVEDALRIYVKILENDPADMEVLLVTGHICVSLRQFEDAGVFYRRVLEIEPWNMDARETLDKLGDKRNESINDVSGVLPTDNMEQRQAHNEVAGKSPEETLESVQSMISAGNNEKAIQALEDLVKENPDQAIAHNDLGVLCYNCGDKERALTHYEKAAHLQPGNKTFQKNLADFYYVEAGRVEDAMRIYVRILENDPGDMEVLLIVGHICVSLKQFEDAGVFYRRVLEIEPWNMDARENLNKLGDKRNESINDVSGVLNNDNRELNQAHSELAGKSPEETLERVQSMVSAGHNDKAIQALEDLVKENPDHAIAHNDLGVLCYNCGDKEKALAYYEKAVQLQPGNITFQKNLADFTYVELSRAEDAMRIYVRILETDPEDIETLLNCGRICEDYKQIDDAKIFYNRVLKIEPWNFDARESLDNLGGGVSL